MPLQSPSQSNPYALVLSLIVSGMVALYACFCIDPPIDGPSGQTIVLLCVAAAAAFFALFVVPIHHAIRDCFERKQEVLPAIVLVSLGSWLGYRILRRLLSSLPVSRCAPAYPAEAMFAAFLFLQSLAGMGAIAYFETHQENARRAARVEKAAKARSEEETAEYLRAVDQRKERELANERRKVALERGAVFGERENSEDLRNESARRDPFQIPLKDAEK